MVDVEEAQNDEPLAVPTGDMEADVKTMIDLMIQNTKNPSMSQDVLKTQKEFQAYYKDKGQGDEWDMALGLATFDNKELMAAMEDAMKKAGF